MRTTPETLPTIPTDAPEEIPKRPVETSEGRLYARRGKYDPRATIYMKFDYTTTEALIEAQKLEAQARGSEALFSRSTFIRRAVLMYSKQMIRAAMTGNTTFMTGEAGAMQAMSRTGKKYPNE